MQPELSIVVLNYNTSDLLGGALQSIIDTAGKVSFDVTVIDNASSDGGFLHVPEQYKKDPRFTFVQEKENKGWVSVNRMLKTGGRYIVTLDPDAVLRPGALQALVAFMDTHQEVGAATARLLNADGTPQYYYRRLLTPLRYFFTTVPGRVLDKYIWGLRHFKEYRYDGVDFSSTREVEQPAWPCLIWRRDAVEDYLVEPRLPFYFLDVDMSRRLYDRGYTIFAVADAEVFHLKSTSYGRRPRSWQRREFYRSLAVYFRKHYAVWMPLLLPLIWFDRLLRALLLRTIGREPLR